MIFWERFFELCKSVNKKPNTVCNDLGFSSATATHWKNGTIPKGDALLILSDYFKCSVDYLLGRVDEPKTTFQNISSSNIINGSNGNNSPLTVNNNDTDDVTKEIVDLVKSLPLVERAKAIIYLNELITKNPPDSGEE